MDSEEIDRIITTQGLFGALLEFDRANQRAEELIARIAEAVSRRNTLLSERDADQLEKLSNSEFFNIQLFLCEIIPFLDSTPREVMDLVRLLNEKGGDDRAAIDLDSAFRKWCASDAGRADEIIMSARAEDPLALRHLVFALEAKGDFQEAFCSAEADGAERSSGVLALSRMTLTEDEAARGIEHILNVVKVSEVEESAGLLKAALNIGAKHPELDRENLAQALHRMSDSDTPIVVHLVATALRRHHGKMTSSEVQSCLEGILRVDPKNQGTIQEIDAALRNMWETDPLRAGQTAAKLIARTEGCISADELYEFFSATKSGDHRNLARLATDWLLEGDCHVCSTLSSHLSEINRTAPCVDVHPEDLPPSAAEQIFICRKAIGFLFTSPMTAASWIVAVLRGGHAEAAGEVAELLFDPLLLNYSGALKDWLENIACSEAHGVEVIASVLKRAQENWDGLEAAREVLELEPPASHRALVRFQEAEEAARVQEMAWEKSIFASIVTPQTLLYGDQSSFSIRDNDGKRHPQSVHMGRISVSSELPKGDCFDPVGTEKLLETFCNERREAT